jgi:flagellar biosynthetic protein FliO
MRPFVRQMPGAARPRAGRALWPAAWCALALFVALAPLAWAQTGGAPARGVASPAREVASPAQETASPELGDEATGTLFPSATAGAPPMATLSAGGMLLRVGLGLALVLGLLGGVLMLYRKATRGRPGLRGDATIEIVSQRSLGQRTTLAVVRVAGEMLLLGITQQQINTLAHLGALAQEARAGAPAPEGAAASSPRHAVVASRPPGAASSPQDAADVEALIAAAQSAPQPGDFQSALEGEVQRVKQGLWASVRRLEASAK